MQLISDQSDEFYYSDLDMRRFLRSYIRVSRPAACLSPIDQSRVTVWTSSGRDGWLKADREIVPKSGSQSWCRLYLTSILGLSPAGYERAQKDLFTDTKSLNGVYRKSDGSYALVYRKPSSLSAGTIAAVTGGALVATGLGVAKVIHSNRQKKGAELTSKPFGSFDAASSEGAKVIQSNRQEKGSELTSNSFGLSDSASSKDEESAYTPCKFGDLPNDTQLRTDIRHCWERNIEFILKNQRIPLESITPYELAVQALGPTSSDPYQTQINAIKQLDTLGTNLRGIQEVLNQPTYMQIINSDLAQGSGLHYMLNILSSIGNELVPKLQAALRAGPIFKALQESSNLNNFANFGLNVTNPFKDLLQDLRSQTKDNKPYFEMAVHELLDVVRNKAPQHYFQDLSKVYSTFQASNQEDAVIPHGPLNQPIGDVGPVPNLDLDQMKKKYANSLKAIEGKLEDSYQDVTADLENALVQQKELTANGAVDDKFSKRYGPRYKALQVLNTLKTSKKDVIELLERRYTDIVQDPVFPHLDDIKPIFYKDPRSQKAYTTKSADVKIFKDMLDNDKAMVEFSKNGNGMDPNLLKKYLELLRQLSDTGKDEFNKSIEDNYGPPEDPEVTAARLLARDPQYYGEWGLTDF